MAAGTLRRNVMTFIKQISGTYSIFVAIPWTFEITFPDLYERFLARFAIINFNFSFSLECMIKRHITFKFRLLMATLGPLIVVFAIILIGFAYLSYQHCRRKPESGGFWRSLVRTKDIPRDTDERTTKLVIAYLVLLILFLFYTSTSTMIFRALRSCDKLDQNYHGSDQYMYDDYGTSCKSNQHLFIVVWAWVMLFIYPIGIPVLCFWLMWPSRSQINPRLFPYFLSVRRMRSGARALKRTLALKKLRVKPDNAARMIQYWWRELKTNGSTLKLKLALKKWRACDLKPEIRAACKIQYCWRDYKANAKKWAALRKNMENDVNADFRSARADLKVELRNDLMAQNKKDGKITILELLSFMYDTYEPRYWWFECFDYFRRLALTGLMVVLNPGTALQGFIGVIISVLGLIAYIQFKPFKEGASDWMGVTTQLSTFFVFLSALMIQVNAVYHRTGFAKLLVVVTVMPPFITLCWAFRAFWRKWKCTSCKTAKNYVLGLIGSGESSKGPPDQNGGPDAVSRGEPGKGRKASRGGDLEGQTPPQRK